MTGRNPLRHVVLAVLSVCLAGPAVHAQHLSIQGDRFAVDGAQKFLTFISYFGAMGADNVMADLRFIKSKGFDGVRIWPNSPDGPQLMNSDASLSGAGLARLVFILDRARDERLLVDVSFTAEHIRGLTVSGFRAAIVAATRELASYKNILFDIQNERNIYGPLGRPLAASDVPGILSGIKSADPGRIVTASNSPGLTASAAADFTDRTGLDVTAYHDPRVSNWYQWDQILALVSALRANGRPAYLQEPTRYPHPSTDRADYFREAVANAKRAGAAAWCFHTNLGFNLQGRGTRFEVLLGSRLEPEWNFVNSVLRSH